MGKTAAARGALFARGDHVGCGAKHMGAARSDAAAFLGDLPKPAGKRDRAGRPECTGMRAYNLVAVAVALLLSAGTVSADQWVEIDRISLDMDSYAKLHG